MLKKIRNIIIILILLVSTTGVSLSKHYSGGKLYSIALFGDAESCCKVPCDCCSDETDFMKLDIDFVSSTFNSPEISIIDLLSDFNFSYITSDYFKNLNIDQYIDWYPDISPPKIEDSSVFFQTFLC